MPQAQRLVGHGKRLLVTPVGVELPCQGVGREHILATVPLGPSGSEALGQPDAVIGAVKRRFTLDVHAVGGDNALLGVEQGELPAALAGCPLTVYRSARSVMYCGKGSRSTTR